LPGGNQRIEDPAPAAQLGRQLGQGLQPLVETRPAVGLDLQRSPEHLQTADVEAPVGRPPSPRRGRRAVDRQRPVRGGRRHQSADLRAQGVVGLRRQNQPVDGDRDLGRGLGLRLHHDVELFGGHGISDPATTTSRTRPR
jgi:hypothetical protein